MNSFKTSSVRHGIPRCWLAVALAATSACSAQVTINVDECAVPCLLGQDGTADCPFLALPTALSSSQVVGSNNPTLLVNPGFYEMGTMSRIAKPMKLTSSSGQVKVTRNLMGSFGQPFETTQEHLNRLLYGIVRYSSQEIYTGPPDPRSTTIAQNHLQGITKLSDGRYAMSHTGSADGSGGQDFLVLGSDTPSCRHGIHDLGVRAGGGASGLQACGDVIAVSFLDNENQGQADEGEIKFYEVDGALNTRELPHLRHPVSFGVGAAGFTYNRMLDCYFLVAEAGSGIQVFSRKSLAAGTVGWQGMMLCDELGGSLSALPGLPSPSGTFHTQGASLLTVRGSESLYLLVGGFWPEPDYDEPIKVKNETVFVWELTCDVTSEKCVVRYRGNRVLRSVDLLPLVTPSFRWGFGVYVNRSGEIEIYDMERNMDLSKITNAEYWTTKP